MKKRSIEEWLVIILLSVMAILGFGNVLSRYIFHISFAATEEIEINMFVWVTVIGIAMAFEKGAHLGMTTVYDKFPVWAKKVATVISALLATSLFALVDYYSVREIYKDLTLFHARSDALNIPIWIYTIGIPIFSIFIFEKLVSSTARNLKSLNRGAK
jgi:TRAP-type C4-dicarboxylate transport system permease small subunit